MNTLTTFLTIITILLVLTPLLVIGISALVSREQVLSILERFMVLIQSPFDSVRNIFRNAYQFIWNDMIKRGLKSVGINKEHWIQRSFGAVLFSITCLLGVIVMVLNNILTFEGLFETPIEDSISQFLPVSVEVFMGIELIIAVFAAGAMILDLLGISHLIKYLSKDFLPLSVRWILGTIISMAFIGGIYLTVIMGVIRTNSIFGTEPLAANTNITEIDNNEILIPDLENNNDGVLLETSRNDNASTLQYSEAEKEKAGIIMKGIPLISNITGFFAGLGFIPLCAMVITLPLLAIEFIIGLFYLAFSLVCRLIDLLYNFLLAVFDALITAGQTIRNRFMKKDNHTELVTTEERNIVREQSFIPVDNDVQVSQNVEKSKNHPEEANIISKDNIDQENGVADNNEQVEIIPENSKAFNPLA